MPRKSTLTREQALSARPLATTILAREPLPGGGQRITVRYQPGRWQRLLLRVPSDATKRYELDALGVEVLGLCDGRTTVRAIANRFIKAHRIDPHEGERAVLAFLELMLTRGVIHMVVARG